MPIVRKMKNSVVTLSQNEGTILYFRHHPTEAVKYLFGVKLNWLQRIALRMVWKVPFSMLVWGRRNGKTYVGAILCVLRAMLFPNERIIIVAPSKRQVDWVFLNEISKLYNESDYFKASVVGKIVITNGYDRIKFTNGSIVEGFPVGTEGNKVRGAGADLLWIDEFAQMSENIVNLVFKPMLLVKKKGSFNRFLITSSAFYRWNHLWPLFQYYVVKMAQEPAKYFVSNFNYKHLLLSKNLPVDFDMNIIEEAKNTMTEEEYAMEYLGSFPAEGTGFFSSKLIESSTPKLPNKKPFNIELKGDGKSLYYMGVDAARSEGGSNFAIAIVKKLYNSNKKVVCHIATLNGATFQVMVDLIRRLYVDFNVSRVRMDSGGGGTTLKDLLMEKWYDPFTKTELLPLVGREEVNIKGYNVIDMVTINAERHNNLHMNIKSEMEHGRLLFPLDLRRDSDVNLEKAGQELIAFKTELKVMKAIPKGRYLRFVVPKRFRTDRVMAVSLALEGFIEDYKGNYEGYDEELAIGTWIGN